MLTNEPRLCHGHFSCRLFSKGLPKMFWLLSQLRWHLESPNQTPEAIIIHLHCLILERLRTGWRFEHFSTNLLLLGIFSLPLTEHPSPSSHRASFPSSHWASSPSSHWASSPSSHRASFLILPQICPLRVSWPGCQISNHLKKRETKCSWIHASSPLPLLMPQSLNQ